MKNELVFRLVTKGNLQLAVSLQNAVFPHDDGYQNYYESAYGLRDAAYWIIYLDEKPIGFVGIYNESSDESSAWLGWFGFIKEERRKGYGSKALVFFQEEAKARGYKTARLWTEAIDNEAAIAFYQSHGFFPEPYSCQEDPDSMSHKVIIFSKSLDEKPLEKWGHRNAFLTKQMEKEKSNKRRKDGSTPS